MPVTVKDYAEFTQDERNRYNDAWTDVLNCHCSVDDDDMRPCDYGVLCDRCHYDWDIQHEFAVTLADRNIPIDPRTHKFLAD